MNSNEVHLLWHTREDDEYHESSKLIGVYASTEECDAAKERIKNKPGFVAHPNGFEVSTYEIGKDHWMDGFGFD